MNILITSEYAGMAGSTYSTFYLARGLAERGHQVYVACPSGSLLHQLLQNSKARHIPIHIRHKLDRQSIRHLASIVRQYQIDIIDGQSSKDRYTTILARWMYKLPVKLVHTRRQLALSMGILGQSWFYEKGTDKNIAVSEGVRQSLIRIGINPSHIEVIYNGTPKDKYERLDPAKTAALREKFGIEAGEFVIGCVGRKKEQLQLLQAVARLERAVKVIFVGIETEKAYQDVIATFRQPHQVFFEGRVDNPDLLNYYPLFDIKVLPSTIEGLSQALLEAMAMKVPVIATNLGGNGELIEEGMNGYLFENGDIDQLSRLILQLMDAPDLRKKMGTYGRHTALEKFSLENTILRHEQLFERLLATSTA
jgi:glycosyltransferase involved in cell wall biosynthesis